MDRKGIRNKLESLFMGEKEMNRYLKALEISKVCDNLPPDIKNFIKDE